MKIFFLLDKNTQKNLLVLFICGLLYWFNIASLLPVIPAYIKDIGNTLQELGLAMGAYAISLVLSRSFLGNVADRRGRKIVLLVGTILVTIDSLGYLLIKSIYGLIFIRALDGISMAAFSIAYDTLIVDLSPNKNKGEVIGYMTLVSPLSLSFGSPVGGFMFEKIGYNVVFMLAFIAGLLATFYALQVEEKNNIINNIINQEISENTSNVNLTGSQTVQQLLWNYSFLIPTIIMLLLGIIFGTLINSISLYIRELSTEFNVGFFYAVAAIASCIVRFISGNISDRYGRGIFITISIVCYGISMFILSYARTSLDLILAAIIEGIASGIIFPSIITLMSDRCRVEERGKVFAICAGGFEIGLAISGTLFSYITAFYNYQTLYYLATLIAVSALTIFITLSNKGVDSSLGFALGITKDFHNLENSDQ